jgi:signal transduction histidine kinase
MSRIPFRDVRTRLLLAVLVALAVALVAATAGFNVLLVSTSTRDANSLLRQRAEEERALVQVQGGQLRLPGHAHERIGESRVWVFSGSRMLEAPTTSAEVNGAAMELARGPVRFRTLNDPDVRLMSLPIVQRGARLGTIVAAVSLAPYEHTERVALVASVGFASILLLLAGASVWWLLRFALRPVARMTEQAAAWVETDLDGRFRLGEPYDELTRLAWTLDQMLDRIAASLRHERLLSAELSHELRTPLAKLRAEAEIALRRPRTADEYTDALLDVIANADRIEQIVEVLLSAAKYESGQRGVADAGAVARGTAVACAPIAELRNVDVEVLEPMPVRIGVDATFAERVLHPVIENACRYAREHVRVTVSRGEGAVLFTISDDGPGVAEDERARIFEPATRGASGRRAGSGAGLGLALSRRLARSVTGDVEVGSGSDAGGCFLVRLPAA